MKKRYALIALIITGVMFIAGLTLIFSAPSLGLNAGDAAVRRNFGSMDTNQYERIVDGSIASYQSGGLVIALVGGIGVLLNGYIFYKEL